jgi:hypothetical protein
MTKGSPVCQRQNNHLGGAKKAHRNARGPDTLGGVSGHPLILPEAGNKFSADLDVREDGTNARQTNLAPMGVAAKA